MSCRALFKTWPIVSTPVNRITIGGQLVGGAWFTGQSTLLTATLYDEANTVRAMQRGERQNESRISGDNVVVSIDGGLARIRLWGEPRGIPSQPQ